MSKFKEGDEVKIVTSNNPFSRFKKGNTYKIAEVNENEVRITEDGTHTQVISHGYEGGSLPPEAVLLKTNTSKSNMSDSFKPFYVEVDGPNHSRMLQEIAFEEGYGWSGKNKQIKHTSKNFLFFTPRGDGIWNDKEITHSNSHPVREVEHLKDPTPKKFRQALRGNYDWEDPIVVQGYEVEFKENKIKVGCDNFHNDIVKGVYEASKIGSNATNGHLNLDFKLEHSEVGEIPFEVVEAIYNRIES